MLARILVLAALALAAVALPAATAAGEEPDEPDCVEVGCAEPDADDPEEGPDEEESEEACEAAEGEDDAEGDSDAGDGSDAGDDGEAEGEADGDPDADEDGDELLDDEVEVDVPLFRDFCEAPVFSRGLLARAWTFSGSVEDYAGGELAVVVERVRGIPARWREEAAQLLELEAVVHVGRRTAIAHRRRGARSRRSLRRARDVQVTAKLMDPADWDEDEDGLLVPTFKAKRVRIVR